LIPASEFEVVAAVDEISIADFDEIFRASSSGGSGSLEELREKD
jgi:hypothetical protein